MLFGMTYYQILWYFLLYSFIGWIVEVVFHAVTLGKVINRGFLNGPVCPVYGNGVLLVFALLGALGGRDRLSVFYVFLFGFVLASAVELLAGWLLDVCFHARWWDYSDNPLNFHGYICMGFSIVWGLAIVLVVRVVQPGIDARFVDRLPEKLGWVLLAAGYTVYLIDFIVTVAVLRGLNKKLTQLEQLREDLRIVSDKLSGVLGSGTLATAQAVGEGRVQAALAKAELRDAVAEKKAETAEELKARKAALQEKFEELSASMTRSPFGMRRFLKAFPQLAHHRYTDLFAQLRQRLH